MGVGHQCSSGGPDPRSRLRTWLHGERISMCYPDDVDRGTGSPSFRAGRGRTVTDVGAGSEVREFLTTRRARVTPEQAGLRPYGGRRRVKGLRREEVAMLAAISVEYYTQLEREIVRGVS